MASAATADFPQLKHVTSPRYQRWTPLSGIAFVVFFVASVLASSPPADTASDTRWIASYTGHGNQAHHLATGICLILAALSLISFICVLWTRIVHASRPTFPNPLPLVAAGVSAACIALGGVLMAVVSGSALLGSSPVPSAELLRFSNDGGFAMAGIGGMLAAALCVACVSIQARGAAIFGRKLTIFSLVVAVVLLASFAFVPILALLAWLIVTAITLVRQGEPDTMGAR
ncbi:MAG TPA: hypothetical protein VGM80_08230 [Gaiellaceae bacterium]|jgi:hypothetical protein